MGLSLLPRHPGGDWLAWRWRGIGLRPPARWAGACAAQGAPRRSRPPRELVRAPGRAPATLDSLIALIWPVTSGSLSGMPLVKNMPRLITVFSNSGGPAPERCRSRVRAREYRRDLPNNGGQA